MNIALRIWQASKPAFEIIGEFLALLMLFIMIIGWAALYYGWAG